MAIGVYGTTIPIHLGDVDIANMVDIFYCYHATRAYDDLEDATFKRLNSGILKRAVRNGSDEPDNIVEGMYNLQLPLQYFHTKGFYTVYIKPREIEAVITDVGNLSAYSDVRGLILDTSTITNPSLQTIAQSNNGLVGYRIIYFSDAGEREDYYRIITSSNSCEPVIQAPNSSSDKSYSYRYSESTNLTFVTVTPSAAPHFKSNVVPYIGKPAQKICLVNTFFEPVVLDIEMVNHDADTISYMLENPQLRDLDNGLVTTFNDDNEIYLQNEHYTLKDQYTGRPIFEVKQKRIDNIDFTQTLDDK